MSVGKYSPTVREAYYNSQDWFKAVDEYGLYDAEGYDSYGYNEKNYDRAGHHENDYLACGTEREYTNRDGDVDSEWCYPLVEEVAEAWTYDKVTGQPKLRT